MYTYEQANKELEKVVEYLKETEAVWNTMMDLKLHDAFFEAEDICKEYPIIETYWRDEFQHFCDLEYDTFMEMMQADGIKECMKYIGRTSRFYLTDINDRDMQGVICNLFGSIVPAYSCPDLKEEAGKVLIDPEAMRFGNYTDTEILEMVQEELEYIISGEFLKDIKEYLKDAIWIYDYITTAKAFQIENFRTYIEDEAEMLQWEQEQKREREQKIQEITMACYI